MNMANSRIVNIQNARPASHGKSVKKEILIKMKHMNYDRNISSHIIIC